MAGLASNSCLNAIKDQGAILFQRSFIKWPDCVVHRHQENKQPGFHGRSLSRRSPESMRGSYGSLATISSPCQKALHFVPRAEDTALAVSWNTNKELVLRVEEFSFLRVEETGISDRPGWTAWNMTIVKCGLLRLSEMVAWSMVLIKAGLKSVLLALVTLLPLSWKDYDGQFN